MLTNPLKGNSHNKSVSRRAIK